MESIKEIMENPTDYQGSQTTCDMVREEIEKRWGSEEAEKYDPYTNARTFSKWAMLGYRIKKGEKAIRSFTIVEKKDKRGKVVKRYRKPVFLFYVRQVEKPV